MKFGWHRTMVFIEKETQAGQDLFIRGGISHEKREGNVFIYYSSLKTRFLSVVLMSTEGFFLKT